MRPQRECAPASCTEEARGVTKTLDALSAPHPVADAQAGKWLAMALYNYGIADMGATEVAFARHPKWAAA